MAFEPGHIFQHLAQYNERANREMYEVLEGLADADRKRNVGSWFESLHGICNHVIVCDLHWLQRYRALSPESPVLADPRLDPPNLSWHHVLHDNFADLRESRIFVDERIRAWFGEFPASRCGETFHYRDSSGTLRPAEAGRAFTFFFVHQTHHRGQVSQVLDLLGLPNNFADNARYIEE